MSVVFKLLSLIVILLNLQWSARAARLLCVFPIPFRDQQLIFRPLIGELSKRGHHLTILTTDPIIYDHDHDEAYHGNVDLVDLSFAHRLKVLDSLVENDLDGYEMLRSVFTVMRTVAEAELKSVQIQELLGNDTESFDAILVDWSGPSLMNGFAFKYKVPLIGITPGGAYMSSHEAMGNPNHPVMYPSILMPFSENLSLFQRIASTIFSMRVRYMYFNEEIPIQHEIAKEYFGDDIPNPFDVESTADLLLVNNYPMLGNARPVGPTTVFLGGMHLSPTLKQLPSDLQHFLDESYGAVYISLPASLRSAFVNTKRLEKLVNVLESTNFDVVWNLNGFPFVANTTGRFFQAEHLPQQEVLAHKNVRLFITTGGQRDVEDAIHYAVPVLGFSFSSNIEHYLIQLLKHEAGIVSSFDLDSEMVIMEKLVHLDKDSRYKSNMEKLSRLLQDEPMTPLERAVWWIEYVLRNNGTKHFSHPRSRLSWFQYLLLDVYATIFAAIAFVICVLAVIFIKLRRYSKSLPFEKETRRIKHQKIL